ncbi:MAG: hypothetical protein HN509_18460 [Halobacteriovoraceae bacterium]|jgi:hypothetical protein|nr:hypothetical protein [Halobacteriovoraceae bacterium]MBT5094144.1 hypothetical protein [Halobacteriovoraceae bacterium]
MVQFQLKSSSVLLLTPILLLLNFGCSKSAIKKNNPKRKIIAKNLSFDELEKIKAIKRYKRLREVRIFRMNRKIQRWRKFKAVVPKRVIVKKKKVNAPKKTLLKKPKMSPEKIRELEIEVKQNLSYYCMRHRKDKRFEKSGDCKSYTLSVYANCDKKFNYQKDKRIVSCLKRNLRR